MSLKSVEEIRDYLKKEYVGDERIKGTQILNLVREFELQRIKEFESVKEHAKNFLKLQIERDFLDLN